MQTTPLMTFLTNAIVGNEPIPGAWIFQPGNSAGDRRIVAFDAALGYGVCVSSLGYFTAFSVADEVKFIAARGQFESKVTRYEVTTLVDDEGRIVAGLGERVKGDRQFRIEEHTKRNIARVTEARYVPTTKVALLR